QYNVYALEGDALTGTPIFLDLVMTDYDGILPPIKPLNQDPILQYLQNPMKEVVSDTLFKISEFRPSFGLRYIGQASIGLATDRFGTSIGGGISMLFSDVLNDHILGLGLQMNGGLKDFGGEVVYQNLKKRPAWGAAISHIPYRIEQTFLDLVTINIGGTPVVAQQLSYYRQRVFNDRILLLGEYPLSINRRVEGTIGYNRIWFDNEIEQITFIGDQILERKTISLPSEPGLDLMQTSLAYVGDYSFFGFTSPVNGSRYRFEVEGTVGSLNFATFLADYRKYLFHNPFTLAFRFLHYGRYFGDSESSRLTPLFIGYETYVRGYSPESYDVNECTDGSGNGDCPEFDRLLGSRMAIFNTELRIALFGTRRLGLINFPVLPTELVFFFDGGAAWTSSQSIKLKWKTNTSERVPVFSAGVALRFNIFNILIPQVYYAFPFQRPQKKGLFGFVLAVGW
ncbi:MAG: tolB protein precursor, partial [Methanobacteriota archaeon]